MTSIRARLAVAVSAFCVLAAAAPAAAQQQTSSQIKCIAAMNDAVSKVAKTQFGAQMKCLKAATGETLPMGQTIADCVTADTDGKIATAVSKAAAKEAKVCPSGLVDFAYTSSATATTAGRNAAHDSFDDAMALDASGSIILSASDPAGSKCQAAVAKGASKVLLAMLAEFRSCKKSGLSDGSITSSLMLGNQCFDAVTSDASGKIGAATSKLADAILAKCAESSQAAYLPGDCAGAPDASACLARIAKCRTCQAFNSADNLVRACDQYDDGAINGSCETSTTCDDDDGDTYGENCAPGDDCNDVNPNIHPGAVELCNGVDDDCDLTVDDSAVGTGGACGSNSVPPCMLGTTQCVSGALDCVGEVGPGTEVCNDIDDDCNGTTDDFPTDAGTPCGSSSTYPCSLGTSQCVGGVLTCTGAVGPVAETCNGIDDDCDGVVDSAGGSPPTDSQGSCAVPLAPPMGASSPCSAGTLTCIAGVIDCQSEVGPSGTTDMCLVDANCDGALSNQPDTMNDVANCGACGNNCQAGSVHATFTCTSGTCEFSRCQAGYYDLDANDTCEYPCSFVSAEEACNGIDDDCDGQVDEGVTPPSVQDACGVSFFASDAGCTTGVTIQCVSGTWDCTFPANYCTTGECYSTVETCGDGLDNDCNGSTDEDPSCGGCSPNIELCDGCDNDCNGLVDDFAGIEPCGPTTGGCAGQRDCIGGGAVAPGGCITTPHFSPTCTQPPATEDCDGIDDDCDYIVDDGVAPSSCEPPGAGMGTVYGGSSQCQMGTQPCGGACQGGVGPSGEVCDGIDNDCDGIVDESPVGVGQACGLDEGPCNPGTTACVGGAIVCLGGTGPQPELCDGVDNDCDQAIDEAPLADAPASGQQGCWTDAGMACSHHGLQWSPPAGATCNGNGSLTSPCSRGSLQCLAGAWSCENSHGPSAEMCNGIDDDCDGTTDDAVSCGPGLTCQSGLCRP